MTYDNGDNDNDNDNDDDGGGGDDWWWSHFVTEKCCARAYHCSEGHDVWHLNSLCAQKSKSTLLMGSTRLTTLVARQTPTWATNLGMDARTHVRVSVTITEVFTEIFTFPLFPNGTSRTSEPGTRWFYNFREPYVEHSCKAFWVVLRLETVPTGCRWGLRVSRS